MGSYHGHEGFDTFSKLRPVSGQGPVSLAQMFFQPRYSRIVSTVGGFDDQIEGALVAGPVRSVGPTEERMIRDHGKVS
jgi:hypothetical protein